MKRVIGLPGDVIEVGGGRHLPERHARSRWTGRTHLSRQGASRSPLHHRARRTTGSSVRPPLERQPPLARVGADRCPPVRVPEGHVYVLGDHRTRSGTAAARSGPVQCGAAARAKVLFMD